MIVGAQSDATIMRVEVLELWKHPRPRATMKYTMLLKY